MYLSADQTIGTAAFTKINFNAELFDTDGEFDVSNSRWTPKTPGKYIITCGILILTTTARVFSCIYKNGAILNGSAAYANGTNNGPCCSAVVDMNGTTDYLEFFTYQESGTDKTLLGASAWTFATGALIANGPKGDAGPAGPPGSPGAAGACVLVKGTQQSIASATMTKIAFAAADVRRDDLGGFSDANDTITVPETGIYAVFSSIHYTLNLSVGEICQNRIYVNGSGAILFFDTAGTTTDCLVSGSCLLSLNAGDTVSLYGYKAGAASTIHNTGGTFLHLSAVGSGPKGDPGPTGPPGDESGTIEFVIDGGGQAISTGMKGYLEVPMNCAVERATLLADRSGSIVVDVFKCSYSDFLPGTHPVAGDKITASAPPTISAGVKSRDTTLSGWSKNLSEGDVLGFNVNSASTIQRVTLSLKVGPQ